MEERKYSSTILDLITRRRQVVSFMPLMALSLGKPPPPPPKLHRMLGGPQNRFGHYGVEKNLAPARDQTLVVQLLACHHTVSAIPQPI
jgi:hypothetical protein